MIDRKRVVVEKKRGFSSNGTQLCLIEEKTRVRLLQTTNSFFLCFLYCFLSVKMKSILTRHPFKIDSDE